MHVTTEKHHELCARYKGSFEIRFLQEWAQSSERRVVRLDTPDSSFHRITIPQAHLPDPQVLLLSAETPEGDHERVLTVHLQQSRMEREVELRSSEGVQLADLPAVDEDQDAVRSGVGAERERDGHVDGVARNVELERRPDRKKEDRTGEFREGRSSDKREEGRTGRTQQTGWFDLVSEIGPPSPSRRTWAGTTF